MHGTGVCSTRWLACLCISIHAHFFPTITQHTASTRYLPLRVRFAFGLKRESVVHQRAWVHVLMGQGRRVYDTDTTANSLVNNEDLRGTGTEDPRSVTGMHSHANHYSTVTNCLHPRAKGRCRRSSRCREFICTSISYPSEARLTLPRSDLSQLSHFVQCRLRASVFLCLRRKKTNLGHRASRLPWILQPTRTWKSSGRRARSS